MKELRELITDPTVSAFLDILPHHDTVAVICTGLGERRFTTNQLAPLIAMHNALPELLDAWEMVKALEWANQFEGWGRDCRYCGMKNVCLDDGSEIGICEKPFEEGRDKLLTAWKDAHSGGISGEGE